MSIIKTNQVQDLNGNPLIAVANGVASGSFAPVGMRNRIINGAMMIAQRGTAAVTTDGSYAVDRFIFGKSGSQTFTAQSSTTVPSGFINSISVTIGTGSTPGASDRLTLTQGIEGLNVADLGWGAAGAQSVTLSFWVRSSLTGAFGVAFRNSATNRSYVASYTVSAANTWEYKTLTIPGDTSGTWAKDNTAGIFVNFDLGCGSTFSTTAGSWQAGNFLGLTGGVKLNSTSGATFYLTGVQLEKGSVATPFEYRPYGTELALCQRYCFVGTISYVGAWNAGRSAWSVAETPFPVTMRAIPTATNTTTFVIQGVGNGTGFSFVCQADKHTVGSNNASGQGDGVLRLITPNPMPIFNAEL